MGIVLYTDSENKLSIEQGNDVHNNLSVSIFIDYLSVF